MENKDNTKLITNIVLIGGILFVGYKIFDKFFSKQNTKKEEETLKGYDKDLDELKKQGIVPTFDASKYNDDANSIKNQLSGIETYSNELKVILTIVNCVKNMADWVMLKKAFGLQDISDAFYGSTKYTLVQLLQDQLDNHVPLYFKVEEDNPPAGQRAWSYTSIFGGDLTLNVLNKFLQSRLRITI